MSREQALAALLDDPKLWRGGEHAGLRTEATGHPDFDRLLPGGGWPVGALSELLLPHPGVGELQLVLPWLARLTQAGGRAALVGPPHLPYAPALADAGVVLSRLLVVNPESESARHWAAEQLLRAACFGTVLAWPGRLDGQDLRRLQLAAETGHAIGILFRGLGQESQASPAALRIRLEPVAGGLSARILKCRGRVPSQPFRWAA